jgi:hypothetical protein
VSQSQPDPIIAYRCWRYDTRRKRLISTVRDTVWTPCERTTAECLRPRPEGQPPCGHPPGDGCGCGIYAWLRREDLRRLVRIEPHIVPVWGTCSVWGTVHMHESGLRAEHAYPYDLRLSSEHATHASDIRATYLVDVETVPVPSWAV